MEIQLTPQSQSTFASRCGASRPRGGAVAVALCILSLAAAGCGGASSAASSAGSSAAGAGQKARLDFASCMRQHGVNVPDPGSGGGAGGGPPGGLNQNTPAFQSAFTACRSHLASAFGNVSAAQRSQFRQQIVKFAACLRQHGQNVADPTFNDTPGAAPGGPGAGGPGGIFANVNRNSPAFQAATKACQGVQPQGPGGGRGFGGPPGG
jgi:hypothetical protein